ncbi:MAG: hypothetical protein AAB932_05210 [Patescibacteria group bacterium]
MPEGSGGDDIRKIRYLPNVPIEGRVPEWNDMETRRKDSPKLNDDEKDTTTVAEEINFIKARLEDEDIKQNPTNRIALEKKLAALILRQQAYNDEQGLPPGYNYDHFDSSWTS